MFQHVEGAGGFDDWHEGMDSLEMFEKLGVCSTDNLDGLTMDDEAGTLRITTKLPRPHKSA